MTRDVLKCHVYNPPIRQSVEENPSLAVDFGLTFIANTGVLLHPLLSQSSLNRRQPTVRSGREVRKNEHNDDGNKYCQSTLNEE